MTVLVDYYNYYYYHYYLQCCRCRCHCHCQCYCFCLLLFSLCLSHVSGTGYRLSETGPLIHLFMGGKRSLYMWLTPLTNLREHNSPPPPPPPPLAPAGRQRTYLQIQIFCQIVKSKKILLWPLAHISSVKAWLPLAHQHIHSLGFQGFLIDLLPSASRV